MSELDRCECGHARCNHAGGAEECLRCDCLRFRLETAQEALEPVEEDKKYTDPDWWKKK